MKPEKKVKNTKNLHRICCKLIFATVGIFLFAFLVFKFLPYPKLKKFIQKPYSTTFYDSNENLIQVLALENGLRREWTSLNKIPQDLQTIFILAEDKNFYFHSGVDFSAIVAASIQNLGARRTVRGASTITMQTVKMIQNQNNRSFFSKFFDILNAYRIENFLTKKEILELYLNSVPFGKNAEGVTSAARTYFGKELNNLSIPQMCCLAVIPRRPSLYNPIENPSLCADKAYDLYKKYLNNVNKKSQKQIFTKEDFYSATKSAYNYVYPFEMPHYIRFLQNEYKNQNLKFAPKEKLYVNLEIQKYAESLLLNELEKTTENRIFNGSVLLMDNQTGGVVAWVGNASWHDFNNSGQIDGVLAKNQPGSSMKPFLYALALEQKDANGFSLYNPYSVLADVPKEFGEFNIYIPSNFNNRFNGPIRFRVSLASSLNVPAVDILDKIGVQTYLDTLFSLGFESLRETGLQADLGLALGAGEVSLSELVPAFSVFTRDGIYLDLQYLQSNKDISYKKLSKKNRKIFETDTARIITSILSDKNSRALGFGYTQTFQTSYPSIFKTGTSNQYQNITALGGTKKWTVGVWMGNFSGETVIGKTGSSLPAIIARSILDVLEEGNSIEEQKFAEPENWSKQKICSLSGMKKGENCKASVYEYVQNGTTLNECNWHIKEDGKNIVIYPPEYQQWLRTNKNEYHINYSATDLQIISPQNNSIFYYDSSNFTKQKIQVEVIGGSEEFLLVEYDKNQFTVTRPFYFDLPVEKGKHVLIVNGETKTERIEFMVK